MGIHLLDNCGPGRACRGLCHALALTFLVAVAPLVLARGTASPVNRLAIF